MSETTTQPLSDTPWEPPLAGAETEALLGALDRQRWTFRWKAGDLDAAGLARVSLGASTLTLGGLLKHLAIPDGKFPVDVVVQSSSGETTGFILVWTDGGYLSTIEHSWVTDQMPDEFPSPEDLRLWDPASNRVWDPRV